MISPFNPDSDLISVRLIEDRLVKEGCEKVTHGMKHTCRWKAPNGRHFHVTNPNVYSLVPPDELETALKRLRLVSELPPPATAAKKPNER
jgi:hypothetical protein